jgi:hypothetical protein
LIANVASLDGPILGLCSDPFGYSFAAVKAIRANEAGTREVQLNVRLKRPHCDLNFFTAPWLGNTWFLNPSIIQTMLTNLTTSENKTVPVALLDASNAKHQSSEESHSRTAQPLVEVVDGVDAKSLSGIGISWLQSIEELRDTLPAEFLNTEGDASGMTAAANGGDDSDGDKEDDEKDDDGRGEGDFAYPRQKAAKRATSGKNKKKIAARRQSGDGDVLTGDGSVDGGKSIFALVSSGIREKKDRIADRIVRDSVAAILQGAVEVAIEITTARSNEENMRIIELPGSGVLSALEPFCALRRFPIGNLISISGFQFHVSLVGFCIAL